MSNHQPAGNHQKNKHRKSSKARLIGLGILSFFLICLVTGCSVLFTICSDLGLIGRISKADEVAGIDYIDLDSYLNNQEKTSIIYAYNPDGELFEQTRLHGSEDRTPISIEDVSPFVKDAVVALEDKRFYNHHGVDWIRTIGVSLMDLRGGDVQGGSTLTQQLIKNLTGENKRTIIRKYKEIKNALSLERHFSKEQILEAYLNTIYLDNGCYGIKTGAQFYFGKDPSALTLMESAILVSITNAPRKYDPIVNYDNNRARAIQCLEYMLDQEKIDQAEYDNAVAEEIQFVGALNSNTSDDDENERAGSEYQSYYTDYIIDSVISDLQAKYNYTREEAWRKVYLGGLRIYSAVDTEIQQKLENIYYNRVTFPDEAENDDAIQSAIVVMDFSGRVVGMVGQLGPKQGDRVINYATDDPRQPGSSIKPLSVYAPAIDSGKLYWSSYFKNYGITGVNGNKAWPTNYGGNPGDSSLMNFPEAIAPSYNTIPARIVQNLGVDFCYSYLRDKFHFTTLSDEDNNYPALAIGAMYYGTTPLDMAAAYVPFCNGGTYYDPCVYYKVEDTDGHVILERDTEGEQVLNPGTADVMIHLLREVVTRSNGTGGPFAVNDQFTFMKTGTSSDNKDKWAVGGTAYYVAAVWSGFKFRKTINTAYYGSNPSGKVFKKAMDSIHADLPYKDFEFGGDAVQRTYCTRTGKLAGNSCTSTSVGWYRVDAIPDRCPGGHVVEQTTVAGEASTKKPGDNANATTKSVDTPFVVTTRDPDVVD